MNIQLLNPVFKCFTYAPKTTVAFSSGFILWTLGAYIIQDGWPEDMSWKNAIIHFPKDCRGFLDAATHSKLGSILWITPLLLNCTALFINGLHYGNKNFHR
jgi:hypothetical protein